MTSSLSSPSASNTTMEKLAPPLTFVMAVSETMVPVDASILMIMILPPPTARERARSSSPSSSKSPASRKPTSRESSTRSVVLSVNTKSVAVDLKSTILRSATVAVPRVMAMSTPESAESKLPTAMPDTAVVEGGDVGTTIVSDPSVPLSLTSTIRSPGSPLVLSWIGRMISRSSSPSRLARRGMPPRPWRYRLTRTSSLEMTFFVKVPAKSGVFPSPLMSTLAPKVSAKKTKPSGAVNALRFCASFFCRASITTSGTPSWFTSPAASLSNAVSGGKTVGAEKA